eukprot:764256-Hanusia_phi.AAC.1
MNFLNSSEFFITARVTCTAPGKYSLQTLFNTTLFETRLFFECVRVPVAYQISPSKGPIFGGFAITIEGLFFISGETVCKFGSDVSQAYYISPQKISCAVQASAAQKNISVTLSNDGTSFSRSVLYFQYVMPYLESISPSVGFINGGTIVTLTPQHFTFSVLECTFASIKVNGISIGNGLWTCIAPPFEEGIVMFEVLGVQSNLRFVYVEVPIVMSLQPSVGIVNSTSNLIQVIGSGFDKNRYEVLFNSHKSNQSEWVSSSIIKTLAPLYSSSQTVQIEVSNAPLISSFSNILYALMNPIQVCKIIPSSIFQADKQYITIYGNNFEKEIPYKLTFRNQHSFDTIHMNKEYLTFEVNESLIGNITAFIEYGEIFSKEFTIVILPNVNVNSVNPLFSFAQGGQLITIFGKTFSRSSESYCNFGFEIVPVNYISNTTLSCLSPPLRSDGSRKLNLEIYTNGILQGSYVFEYRSVPRIYYVIPSIGNIAGGSLVTMIGESFWKIEQVSNISFSGVTTSNFQSLSSSVILCYAPPANIFGDVTISFSNGYNLADRVTSSTFHYMTDVILMGCWPSKAPARSHSIITVTGSWDSSNQPTSCKFGFYYVTSKVTMVSASTILCPTPKTEPGNSTIQLGFDGTNVWSNDLLFQFETVGRIQKMEPTRGPVYGGTHVILQVIGLTNWNNTFCNFGNKLTALWISEKLEFYCLTPASVEQVVSVSLVSTTGEIYHGDTFEFVKSPIVTMVRPSFSFLQGGSQITINGMNFLQGYTCMFDDVAVPSSYITSSLIHCPSPPSQLEQIWLDVTVSDKDVPMKRFRFTYLPSPEVLNIFPTSGSVYQSNEVTIIGSNFSPITNIDCQFGAQIVKGRFLSTSHVLCISYAIIPSNVSIKMLIEEQLLADASLYFVNLPITNIRRIEPSFGSVSGGTVVSIIGYFESSKLLCKFGSEMLDGQLIFETLVECVSPRQQEGYVYLEISEDGVHWTQSQILFLYHNPMSIFSMSPTTGTLSGGTKLTIMGSRFLSELVWCKFGNSLIIGTVVNSEVILCTTPPFAHGGTVDVEISQNQKEYFSCEMQFLFQDVIVDYLFPSFGTVAGGTNVVIKGHGFLRIGTLSCKFDHILVKAVWVSREELWCLSPQRGSGEVTIEVSNNLVDFSTDGNKFEYLKNAVVSYIVPQEGSPMGNTDVTIFGSNFLINEDMRCRFGNLISPIKYFYSSTKIICTTFPSIEQRVLLQVSINGEEYSNEKIYYEFATIANAANIRPSFGPSNGQTLVTISGSGFRNTQENSCKFGQKSAPAKWISGSIVICATPPASQGLTSVQLSNDGLNFLQASIQFLYYDEPEIMSISPTSSPTGITGNEITVQASGILNTPSLSCRFGSQIVTALYQSSSLIKCSTISSPQGLIPFEISNNGEDFTNSGKTFLFDALITIVSMIPSYGIEFGGTSVFLTGSNFMNSTGLLCRFGSITINAVFLASDTIFCISPAQAPGAVELSASNNGHVFNTARMLFHYTRCPVGSYCVESEIITCPAGSFCPAEGLFNFTLCSPGTYQNLVGQSSCKPCSLGSICPDFGMSFPQICPPGYVCDESGLGSATKPCPPGYYCLAGTSTTNFADLASSHRPLACPEGFYCVPGCVTSISILLNFTTPQPCFAGYYCNPGSETPHGQGPCPSGFNCPQYSPGMIKACPPGTFCPNIGNVDPMPCQPGSYNENYAQSVCNACPIGRMCPTFGLLAPRMCPAGYVCDEAGKATWSKLCPAGYWCVEGTVTSNASSALSPRPMPCSPGTYCLMGVSSNKTVPGKLSTPQICVQGTYCKSATGSPQGTAPCPPGYFCGSGVSSPTPASPGYYVARAGSVIQVPCTPGFFAPTMATIRCLECPAGFTCVSDGTVFPSPCPAGTYRSAIDGVSCIFCPTGTWSSRIGLTDESLCEPCPPGVVCSVAGMTNLSMSSPCPEGFVCGPRTNSANQFLMKCPAGYICGFGTTPSSQYSQLCDPGYGCPEGTSVNTKNLFKCAVGYYCPPGSTSQQPAATQCPLGTTSNAGAMSEQDCFRAGNTSICRISPYYSNASQAPEFDCMLKWTCWRTSPNDPAAQSLCVTKGEIEANYDFTGNLLNPTLRNSPNQWEYIEALAVAEFSLDFRNIPIEMIYREHFEIVLYYFNKTQGMKVHKVYGSNGAPGNTGGCPYLTEVYNPALYNNEPACTEFDGTWFESSLVDKHGILKFTIMSHTEIYFRVEIEIFHGAFIANKNFTAFKNTMTVKKFYPSRADYDSLFEDFSVYNNFSAPLQRPTSTAGFQGSSCTVQRDSLGYKNPNSPARPCSRLFLAALDSGNANLNVALNIEAPYKAIQYTTQNNLWHFQTKPWVDFATTNSSVPLLWQPFNYVPPYVKGVGLKFDIAYPQEWSNQVMNPATGLNPDVGSGDNEMIVIPYFPFFSSCRGFDSHIPIFRLFETPTIEGIDGSCKLIPSEYTREVNQYLFWTSPSASELTSATPPQDFCSWNVQCKYEEEIDKAPLPKRWYSQDPGSVLFYLTRDAYNFEEYRDLGMFKSMKNTDQLVEAIIGTPATTPAASLVAVGVPQSVSLTVQYYQRTKTQKKIIAVEVMLDNYQEVSNASNSADRSYSLQVLFHGLDYQDCLNKFAFDVAVYLVLYVIVGIGMVFFAAFFWSFHRLFTRLGSPPKFRFVSYLNLTALPPIQGFALTMFPLWPMIGFMQLLFYQTSPLQILQTQTKDFGPWDTYTSSQQAEQLFVQQGRFAVGLFVVAVYTMWQASRLMVPKKESIDVEEATTSESSESKVWLPEFWRMTHIILCFFITAMVGCILFEYSLTTMFATNFWISKFLLKIFLLFYEGFLEEILGESLLVLPHSIAIDLVVSIATMGAATFLDFMQSFVLETLLNIALRIYIDPGIDAALEKYEWALRVYKRYRAQQEILRDEEGADDDLDMALWEDEEEEETKSPVEDIIGSYASYSAESIGTLFAPLSILFVQWTEPNIGMGAAYGIKRTQFVYFWVFGFVMIPFLLVKDLFLHNVTELHHGWKVSLFFFLHWRFTISL